MGKGVKMMLLHDGLENFVHHFNLKDSEIDTHPDLFNQVPEVFIVVPLLSIQLVSPLAEPSTKSKEL